MEMEMKVRFRVSRVDESKQQKKFGGGRINIFTDDGQTALPMGGEDVSVEGQSAKRKEGQANASRKQTPAAIPGLISAETCASLGQKRCIQG